MPGSRSEGFDQPQPSRPATAESKRASRALNGAASILSAADEAIFQAVGGRFIHVNKAAERMFGYSAEELVGQSPLMLAPRDRAGEIADIGARVRRGETVRAETQRMHRDGTVLDVSLIVLPVLNGADEVIGETAIARDTGAARRAARQLQEADASIRAIFEHIPGGLSLRGLDGRYLHVNGVVAEALGASPAEIVGRDPAEHHDAATAAVIRAEDQEMLRTGLPIVQENRVTHADGTTHDYHVLKYPVRDERGAVFGFGSFSLDVTERTRVENELRMAEHRLRMLLEAAPDAVLVVNEQGLIVRINAKVEEMFGYARKDLLGEPVEMLIPPDLSAAHEAHRRAYIERPQPRQFDVTGRRRDGSEFPIELTLNALPDDTGVQVVTVIHDITLRKHAESAHAQALERFRLAFKDSPVGMVLLDIGGRFERVNDAFCRMVGYSPEQLRGMSFESITHPDDITRNVEGLLAVLAGEEQSYVTEKRYIHASGHEISVSLQTTLLRAADGPPLNFLTHVTDISDRRRHEQQLAQLADHDALTGLLNSGAFNRALAAHASVAERYGPTGAVLAIDLEDLRPAAGMLGQRRVDELIMRAARLLEKRLRDSDLLARLSGCQFAVLLPRAGFSEASRVADSLLEELRDAPLQVGEHAVSASIGIASFEECRDVRGEEMLLNASTAMHEARERGRNCAVAYSRHDHSPARDKGRVAWARRIQTAVAEERLTLLAQPVVEIATGRVAQHELLLRLRDEHGDLVPPATFLCIAERLALIGQIDAWVTGNAIRALAEFEDLPALEVNLSGASIVDPRFPEDLRRRLQELRVDPPRLIFEIDQATALAGITQAIAFREQLTAIGCRFALDGFGAGPASFHHLRHLRFDLIKIDGELVRNCVASDTDQLLIAAIVEVASGLGRRTVAKDVGDSETLMLLRELGVDYGQGYHVGPPVPLALGSGTPRPPAP